RFDPESKCRLGAAPAECHDVLGLLTDLGGAERVLERDGLEVPGLAVLAGAAGGVGAVGLVSAGAGGQREQAGGGGGRDDTSDGGHTHLPSGWVVPAERPARRWSGQVACCTAARAGPSASLGVGCRACERPTGITIGEPVTGSGTIRAVSPNASRTRSAVRTRSGDPVARTWPAAITTR